MISSSIACIFLPLFAIEVLFSALFFVLNKFTLFTLKTIVTIIFIQHVCGVYVTGFFSPTE